MRRPRPVPVHLRDRAFSREEALDAGITPRMLEHDRFVEVFPRVYALGGTTLDHRQRVEAARLSLPSDARLSHLTRLIDLGLPYERRDAALHFTIARDLHLAVEGLILHRTEVMPPHDERAVSVEAAVLGVAATMRPLDVIKIMDWLTHRKLVDLGLMRHLMTAQPWRPGVLAVEDAIPHVEPRSRSLPESEVRIIMVFAGLPRPASNLDVYDGPTFLGCGDLAYPDLRLLVESEGRQHALDVRQFARDIDRYAGFRQADWEYVQATRAKINRPKAFVWSVYRVMKQRGYDGPPPHFGDLWRSLFAWPMRHRPSRDL